MSDIVEHLKWTAAYLAVEHPDVPESYLGVICEAATALAAAQEREQRMREALKPGLANLDALLNDHGYAEDGGLRGVVSELRAALGEPQ